MDVRTHLGIDPTLVGEAIELGPGHATATLLADTRMTADDRGLVHGSFTFGLADYAAMLAVNDPYVVLGGANCRFLAPVRVGETMRASATVTETKGRKHLVAVQVYVEDRKVLECELSCFVLDAHVLDNTGS